MKRQITPKDQIISSLLPEEKNFFKPAQSIKERMAQGKQMRELCSRASQGGWKLPKYRAEPLELLALQDQSRVKHLIPLRYGRMMASPFAFYRGAAIIMANDLSHTLRTGAIVQACGDCHLSNFGIFATPERNVVFDLNDFDETLPGPWEWDLKRLAASFAIAAETAGFTNSVAEACVKAVARVYREKMGEFAHMNTLDVWYHRVDFDFLVEKIKKPGRKESAVGKLSKLKSKRSHEAAFEKLTEVVDGKRRIKDAPPLIYHSDITNTEGIKMVLQSYLKTLLPSRQRLVQRYHFVDIAVKVVGVGSVGTTAGMVLLQGEGEGEDPIFLQVKEANQSVLERFVGRSEFRHSGERVVMGQRLLQTASDLFLGWTSGPRGKHFYIRQLMDMKATVPVDELDAVTLEQYAEVCAYTLARAHARTGDPAIIHGYLGKSESFDNSLVSFSMDYRKQNEQDYNAMLDAINQGKIIATPGL